MKIYGFFNSNQAFGDAVAYAIDETGDILASHISSTEDWARHDLGMNGRSDWKHDLYHTAHPNGYEVEFVRIADDRDAHAGLQAAFRAHEAKYPVEKESEEK